MPSDARNPQIIAVQQSPRSPRNPSSAPIKATAAVASLLPKPQPPPFIFLSKPRRSTQSRLAAPPRVRASPSRPARLAAPCLDPATAPPAALPLRRVAPNPRPRRRLVKPQPNTDFAKHLRLRPVLYDVAARPHVAFSFAKTCSAESSPRIAFLTATTPVSHHGRAPPLLPSLFRPPSSVRASPGTAATLAKPT